ncbi:MAG TPA: hypothetical protein IAD16_03175 [Candidatus Fimisoma avicola]|uniref:Uncharacterized protein n=1 Tax=Candidatus Fimisoma avicola TaxID=2840826 RepID=A0A9D1I3B9_9FIRM|nr:hypothetical protein [Candidatus Fimisoma avicola]
MSDDYTYSERSYDDQPFTKPEIIFINEDLIPFYNNMIDRYSPDAIALVTVKKCPSLQVLKTNSYELLKGVRSCLMRTDKGLVLQSMMSEYRNLTIPIRRITYLSFDPDDIYYLDDPGTDDPKDLRFKIKLDYIADPDEPGDTESLVLYTVSYNCRRHQEYAELLDPQPFMSVLHRLKSCVHP